MEVEKYKMIYELNFRDIFILRFENGDMDEDHPRIKKLYLLGKDFVKNNKNKGKIIFKNKKHPLKEFLPVNEFRSRVIKVKMILNKNIYNKSYMFKDCKSLLHFSANDNYEKIEKNELLYEDIEMNVNKIQLNNTDENTCNIQNKTKYFLIL